LDNQKSFAAAILSVLLHCTIRVLGMAARPGRALNAPLFGGGRPKAKVVVLAGRLLYPLTARQQ
jgi:hypothetical protein